MEATVLNVSVGEEEYRITRMEDLERAFEDAQ